MIKTQIQVPDELYRRVKVFAAQREWSLAETFRRGVEQLLDVYPSGSVLSGEWKLPVPRELGCHDLSADELKQLAQNA